MSQLHSQQSLHLQCLQLNPQEIRPEIQQGGRLRIQVESHLVSLVRRPLESQLLCQVVNQLVTHLLFRVEYRPQFRPVFPLDFLQMRHLDSLHYGQVGNRVLFPLIYLQEYPHSSLVVFPAYFHLPHRLGSPLLHHRAILVEYRQYSRRMSHPVSPLSFHLVYQLESQRLSLACLRHLSQPVYHPCYQRANLHVRLHRSHQVIRVANQRQSHLLFLLLSRVHFQQ